MKKILLSATLFAFVAAPLVACDMDKNATKDTKASLSTEKTKAQVATKVKTGKVVASASTKKAKI